MVRGGYWTADSRASGTAVGGVRVAHPPQWPQARHWLNPFEDERPPGILWSSPSDEVTWSSTWTHHPEVEIRFGLSPRNCGTSVRVELHSPEPVPSEASIGHLRKRILELIFRDLQYSYGS